MRITAKNIKNNYQIFIIKLTILSLFIFSLVRGKIETSIYWNFVAETGSGFQNYLNVLKGTSFYRPAIILLIPLIGIFINKKIGWILIQSYFYFLISNLAFSAKYIDLNDNALILINIIGFLLLLLIIILMNKKKIRNLIYGIEKTELISKNVIASIVGMSITIILAMIKANGI
ncbi:hypothetical protein [Psychroserpens luteus]|uniref:Uncharacterized protein n=1 Tax=Psychroserpens luteus TaxID=1434066 RepID=A0ABW5ZVS3_9FLAO|nr:hypothetical protein [Psychroserpens luteus]